MKRILFLLITFLFVGNVYSQITRIRFDYDTAGNQTVRYLCISCGSSKTTELETKEITKLEDNDLSKFFEEDVISYYPNPVKEELYLKWELIDENKVSKIDIYNLNGQIVKSFTDLEKENSKNISFQEYPVSTYLVLLLYTNGEQKSITIVKE